LVAAPAGGVFTFAELPPQHPVFAVLTGWAAAVPDEQPQPEPEAPLFALALVIAFSIRPLEIYTHRGYIGCMSNDIKTSCQKRLNRIEGQVRGLAKMVDEDRYCIDIVTQISAVRSALRRVEEEILKDHVAHCVQHAINSGDKADQRRKIAELMDVVGRVDR
jgi:DNA-binding FrmR family transcriptional regulator